MRSLADTANQLPPPAPIHRMSYPVITPAAANNQHSNSIANLPLTQEKHNEDGGASSHDYKTVRHLVTRESEVSGVNREVMSERVAYGHVTK